MYAVLAPQVASRFTRPRFLVILDNGPSAKCVQDLLLFRSSDAKISSVEEAGKVSIPRLQRGPALSEDGDAAQRGQARQSHKTVDFSLWGLERENILIATSHSNLPEEQCMVWASTVLMDSIHPDRVIVAGTMPAMSYRGPDDPSQEELVFQLATTKWEQVPSTKVLPPGNLVTGLSAAVLQICHSHSVPACSVISVQNNIMPSLQLVCAQADVVSKLLWGTPLMLENAVKKDVAKALDNMYQSSASNSIFI